MLNHYGAVIPVAPHEAVEVEYRQGTTEQFKEASEISWVWHVGREYPWDIVRYRVLT